MTLDFDDQFSLDDLTKAEFDSISQRAKHAIGEVNDFIAANKGKLPTVPLKNVLRFQQGDKALTADGKWGPNTRKAAAWYRNKNISELPGYDKKYESKLTWVPPKVVTPKPITIAKQLDPASSVIKPTSTFTIATPKPAVVASTSAPKVASQPKEMIVLDVFGPTIVDTPKPVVATPKIETPAPVSVKLPDPLPAPEPLPEVLPPMVITETRDNTLYYILGGLGLGILGLMYAKKK